MEFIISDILVFTFAVFLLLVTPGPGVLSTAGVGSGFGSRAGLVYLIGLFLLERGSSKCWMSPSISRMFQER
ncbi:MAG: hypothetical protein MK437_11690, partial [SAR324 cluster bacterium]|nr:hypothetical protein [SAR324 cluster bacterium]